MTKCTCDYNTGNETRVRRLIDPACRAHPADTELRRLAEAVVAENKDRIAHGRASKALVNLCRYLAGPHPEPAKPDAATGAQDCGCQPARSFVCPPHQIAALEADNDKACVLMVRAERERDAAQAEARRHADRCAALVQEVEGLREALSRADRWMNGCTCPTNHCYGDCTGSDVRAALATPAAPVPSTATPSPTALPCPFCGRTATPHRTGEGDPKHVPTDADWYSVSCWHPDCTADAVSTSWPTAEEAIAAWNIRATPAAPVRTADDDMFTEWRRSCSGAEFNEWLAGFAREAVEVEREAAAARRAGEGPR